MAKTNELEIFSEDIKKLVREMPGETQQIIGEATSSMEGAVRRKYADLTGEVTGNLVKDISSDVRRTAADRVVGMVKNPAPHVALVEFGTNERQAKEKKVLYDKETDTFFGRQVAPMPELAPMRKAYDENEQRVYGRAAEQVFNAMEKRLRGR